MVVAERPTGGEHGPLAGVPQRHVRALDLVGRGRSSEREVQAGAVGVAVRQVGGGGAGVVDGGQGGNRGGVDPGQASPRGGDLHRVHHEALRDEGVERADVVAMRQPLVHEALVEAPGAGALVHHDRFGGR